MAGVMGNINMAVNDGGGGTGKKKTGQSAAELALLSGANGALKGGTSKTPSSGGSSATSGTVGAAPDYNALLAAAYAQQRDAILAQYDDTYNRSMQRIDNAYNTAAGMYGQNLDSTRNQINASYDSSRNDVTRDSERALREAYINNMMNRRNLNQSMSALGLNGGAAESTLASMQNQYGNSRAGIEETRDDNLSKLLQLRDQNLASAMQEYNARMADLANQRMQMENQADNISANARMQLALANMNALNSNPSLYAGLVNGLGNLGSFSTDTGSYTTALKNLVSAQNAYDYDNAQATNAYTPVSAQQAQSALGTNYAKYMQQLQQQYGNDVTGIKNDLFTQIRDNGMSVDTMAQILRQLGVA